MAKYALKGVSEQNLLDNGDNTVRTWGIEQAAHHVSALEDHFESLAKKDAI